jgi:hypothetical protein
MANCYCTRSSVDLCDHCTETFSQGWDSGKAQERERIIQLLQVMRNDLASCIKDDDCLVRADVIDVCISDIKGENE